MPHFGKSNHQFRTTLDSTKQYRITAWLNFKRTWNDAQQKYEPNTPEEISICRKLFEQLAQHPNLQLQLNIDERMSGIDDVKQFPRAAIVNLYVGNMQKPDFQTQQNDAVETSQDLDDEIPFGNSDEADEMVGFE